MPSAVKDELREILDELPEDATAEQLIDELYVRMKVRAGMKAFDEGRFSSHDEVRRRLLLGG